MNIRIGEDDINYTRPHLREWLVLQDKQADVVKAVDTRGDVAKHIISFVSTALHLDYDTIADLPWSEVGIAYFEILQSLLPLHEFPFLNAKIRDKKEVWDYDGRTFYVWVHLFASVYGWSVEYVSNMDVDDAIALAQEVSVEDQLNHEWEWMVSEVAHQSKDGFQPLSRPDWMQYTPKAQEIPKFKIRKDFLPSGIVVRYTPTEPG
jgi:hypothetical protein